MESSKPPPEGKDLPTTLVKHKENFQSWVGLVKKDLSHLVLNNLFFFNVAFDKIICHLIMPLIIIRPKSKIPAFPAKAEEKPMVFQLFQPNSEKRLLIFQLFQPEWMPCSQMLAFQRVYYDVIYQHCVKYIMTFLISIN